MRCVLGLAALAGFAGAGMAQSMYLSASNLWPADGEIVTIDVVLDATGYDDPFFAWSQYGFNIEMAGDGPNQSFAAAVGGDLLETDIQETADTTGFAATGAPWTGGRRPGAFPGSTANQGGSRFGPALADVVTDSWIGSSYQEGKISGLQRSGFEGGANNVLINQSRVYEAFRFEFAYTPDMGTVTFRLTNIVANLYTGSASNHVYVQDQTSVSGVSLLPTPGAVPVLLAGGVAAGRRRRWG